MKFPLLFLLAGSLAAGPAHGAIGIAQDNASNAPYTTTNSWQTGQNGGNALGPWTLVTTGNASTGGFFLATNAGGNANNNIGAGANGNSWGMYANSGAQSAAFRGFTGGSLTIGQSFQLTLDTNNINNGSAVGFTLRTGTAAGTYNDVGTGQRFAFYFVGGGTNYLIDDGTGTAASTGVGYTSGGLTVLFTLVSADTYSLQITPNGGGTTAFTRQLAGTAGAGLDSFAMFNSNAGTGDASNAYFNSIVVVPEPATWLAAAGLAGLVGWTQRRRFAR